MAAPLESKLAAYLSSRMPGARNVAVEGLARIPGGASRETYRFLCRWDEDGISRERRMILRRDPPASLIETDRRIEFEAYRAFYGTEVPVPEMLWLEEGVDALDRPFFIAEEITGFQASPTRLFFPPYFDHLDRLGRRKWSILGAIAKADPDALGLDKIMSRPPLDGCWRRELDHWESVLDADEFEPLPVIRAAIRRLRKAPPPPPKRLSVVHGDFRTGNFLFDEQGEIHGILDWEMAHLGDPLEDLGWAFNPVWSFGRDMPGGLIPARDAMAAWEAASGMSVDAGALDWWMLFNCVKGQAIWISSARAWLDGVNREPILAYPSWALQNAQDRAALKLMGML